MTKINVIVMQSNQLLTWLCLMCFSNVGQAQSKKVTFYQDIEPIIHTNCTPCHQPGKIGPFSLITYQDVAKRAKHIGEVTWSRYMPPWTADRSFQSFANERGLSEKEIETIQAWITNGLPEGKPKKKPTPIAHGPNPPRPPDLSLTMQKPFHIPGNNTEQFRFFSIPTQLPTDTYLEAIEFVPGNSQFVHHSRVMADTTNAIRGIDGMSEDDPHVHEYHDKPLADEFMYGWVPGNFPVFFPKGTAKKLHARTDLVVNIHYAPTSTPQTDQSTVNLYFAKSPVEREVKTLTLTENQISNQPFYLPANTKPTFYMSSGVLPEDISLISILPHMHVLGKRFKAFAVLPGGDIVNLIKIDQWDFRWQTMYQFNSLLHLPKGSVILAEATYDNTAENPENPSRPPRDVGYGWNTTDEMMNLVMYYVQYKPGDEKVTMGRQRDKKK